MMTLGRERKRASSFCVSPKAILTASRETQKEGFFLCDCRAGAVNQTERKVVNEQNRDARRVRYGACSCRMLQG